jgi:hypothetical protein
VCIYNAALQSTGKSTSLFMTFCFLVFFFLVRLAFVTSALLADKALCTDGVATQKHS